MELRNRDRDATPFTTKDGSTIREYLHTEVQSLAEASLGSGQSTQRHYHARSEEIYLILAGGGRLAVGGEAAGPRGGVPRGGGAGARRVGAGRRGPHPPRRRARAGCRRLRREAPLLLRSAVLRRRHVLRVTSKDVPESPISFARG